MSSNLQLIGRQDELIPQTLSDDELRARISKYINDAPRNSRIMRITPEIATWILNKYNRQNRSMKPRAIQRFSRHMATSTWALTGDCLKFSDKGLLRDGQNRLRACVRAQQPFTTHVVFGIPDAYFDRLDQGQSRSSADVLNIAGYPNSTVLQGAVRWVRNLLSDNPITRDGVEPDEALRLVREVYTTLPDFVAQARAVRQTTGQPITLVTGLLYVFNSKHARKAEDFAEGWASGKHAGGYAAIGHMERAIAKLRADSMGRVHDQVRCVLIIRAWNCFVRGEKGRLGLMKWQPGDDFPEILG